MIIGISGKIGTGKDETCKVIRYLTSPNAQNKGTYEECEQNGFVYDVIFENRKFADKLKDIVCMLLGCTREQLEDRDFKEKELGEEWWVYDLGNHLVPRWGFDKNEDNNMCEKRYLVKLTPRRILQLLGTEAGRQIIHPNIWVNSLMSEYKRKEDDDRGVYRENFTSNSNLYPNWIITDMRFPNELEAVKSKGGITIRIERPNEYKEGEPTQRSIHPSETALDNAEFDYVVYNTGTIEQLVEKIRHILTKEGII